MALETASKETPFLIILVFPGGAVLSFAKEADIVLLASGDDLGGF